MGKYCRLAIWKQSHDCYYQGWLMLLCPVVKAAFCKYRYASTCSQSALNSHLKNTKKDEVGDQMPTVSDCCRLLLTDRPANALKVAF